MDQKLFMSVSISSEQQAAFSGKELCDDEFIFDPTIKVCQGTIYKPRGQKLTSKIDLKST